MLRVVQRYRLGDRGYVFGHLRVLHRVTVWSLQSLPSALGRGWALCSKETGALEGCFGYQEREY
eukprot:3515307-Prymnesium_polylepis.2